MRWVPAALLVVLTATACAGGDAEPTSEPTDSPEAIAFLWPPVLDEASRSYVALPEGSRPIANSFPGPDGTTITTRGFVFEHADGVIGYEMIDDYATLDDLEKLADFLAASVGGAVVASEEVDAGKERGADGEIVYGDDQLMLFRILVLNSDGDVWAGFVGGPEAHRERLEREFRRLTENSTLRPTAGWVTVLDVPTGISVGLPDRVPPEDLSDGAPTPVRGYHHDAGVGFIVVEGRPHEDDLAADLGDTAASVEGVVESSTPVDVRGYGALDGIVAAGEWTYLMRVVHLDEQVLILYASGQTDDRQRLTDDVDRLTDSLVIP